MPETYQIQGEALMKLFLGILAAAWKCLRLGLSDDVHGDSDCEDGELLLSSFPMFGG